MTRTEECKGDAGNRPDLDSPNRKRRKIDTVENGTVAFVVEHQEPSFAVEAVFVPPPGVEPMQMIVETG